MYLFFKAQAWIAETGFKFLIWRELVGKMPNYFSGVRNVLYLYPAYSWDDAPGRNKVLIYNCDNSLQLCSWKMSGTFCFCPRKRTETNFKTVEVAMKQSVFPLTLLIKPLNILKAVFPCHCWWGAVSCVTGRCVSSLVTKHVLVVDSLNYFRQN